MLVDNIFNLILENVHLIVISFFGGLVLFGLKVAEYLNRPPEDKDGPFRAFVIYSLLFFCLPLLGAAMASIYIMNGDKMSAVLAFQVGLTSPAIVQSMIIVAANKVAKQPVQIEPGA